MYISPLGLCFGCIVFSDVDLALDELGSGSGIDGVGEMVRVDDNGVFADEIVFEAKGLHLA